MAKLCLCQSHSSKNSRIPDAHFRGPHCALVPGNLHRMYSPLRNHIEGFQTCLAPHWHEVPSHTMPTGWPGLQFCIQAGWKLNTMHCLNRLLFELWIQRVCEAGTALWGDSLNFTSFTKKTGRDRCLKQRPATYTLKKKSISALLNN